MPLNRHSLFVKIITGKDSSVSIAVEMVDVGRDYSGHAAKEKR